MNSIAELPSCSKMISQGAEGRIYISQFFGEKCIIKERFSKKYRVPELDDKINKLRLAQECRNMARACKAGVNVPYLLMVDEINKIFAMQYIENAITIKEYLATHKLSLQMVEQIASGIAKMHNSDIIHGDLTTSNILVRAKFVSSPYTSIQYTPQEVMQQIDKAGGDIFFIDFGLSSMSNHIEDKAVDLYVLKRALISTNPECQASWSEILNAYKNEATKSDVTIKRYEEVERRGRKRIAFG